MTPKLSENDQLLLLLSKDLFRRGTDAARSGDRFSHGVAVSHFHDAVEISARAAAVRIGAPIKPDAKYLEYWSKTNEYAEQNGLAARLKHMAEMGDLNEARKYFKHRGKLMQPEYIVGYQATAHKFLIDTFQEFFSVAFESVSSVTFVRELRVKSALEEAQAALASSNTAAALERCADAWAVTSSQQRAFFPSPGDRGVQVSFDPQVQAVQNATRGEFAQIYDYIYQLARLTFAALLGMNAADVFLLIHTLPSKQGDQYSHQLATESVTKETVAHIIELIADYSSALLRQIDGFSRPSWASANPHLA